MKELIDAFKVDRGFVKFQIESYDQLIKEGLQNIINEIKEVRLTPEIGDVKLIFGKLEVERPVVKEADGSTRLIFPNEARVRNLNYSGPIFVEITPVINGVQEKPERVQIGSLPIMVKSGLCTSFGLSDRELIEKGEDPKDPGGYFIVNGTERVLVLIEEIANNNPIFERSGEGVSVRVNSERSGFKQRHLIERKPDGEITISFANIRKLPITTLLKALGLESDKDISLNISSDPLIMNEFYINLYQEEASSQKEAFESIGKKLRVDEDYRDERVSQILDRYLLPHVGQETDKRIEKAKVLSRIIRKTIQVALGKMPEDDIDHYANKRLLTSGELLAQLFRSILLGRWGLIAKMTYNYQKLTKRGKNPTIQGMIEADAVTKQILSSLATGNWIGGRTGISQRLDRSSFTKTISHLRSVVSPLTSTQEHFKARQIHPTEFGRLCPAETPEGSSIGLRKHLALLAEITPGITPEEEEKLLKAFV